MAFNFPPFSIAFFIGGALALFFASFYWRRYPAPGALLFTLFLLFGALWTLASGVESGADTISAKFFWSKVEFIGAATSGMFWLCFTFDYTGSRWWRRFPAVLLWLFPLATVILTWTNDLHHLVWTGSHLAAGSPYFILIYEHGPWFWVMVASMYLFFIYGMIVLWRFIYHKPGIYHWQIAMLTVGTLIPLVGSIVYLLGFSPIEGLDFVPFTFIFASLIYAIAIFRFRFLDVVPVARAVLVENMLDSVIVLDSDDRIIDMNPAAERMAGFSKSAAQGQRLNQIWPELAQIKSTMDPKYQQELISTVSGIKRYYDVSLTRLHDKDWADSGQMIVLRDITDRKITQKKLEVLYSQERQSSNDLQEELENRSKYVRAIVHELKTPLTAIISSSDLLREEVKDKTLSAVVGNIWRGSLNLERRINELIELARGEIGILKIDLEPVDITQLIQDVVSELTPVASGKGLSMTFETQKLPLVQGDSNRLRQVMINLLGNAIKFTDQGKIVITVNKIESESALIRIQDTGRGIDDEQMKYLFDLYRRKVMDDKLSGLGIGLTLSKMFVDLHKGKIWAESIPGQGSTFSFIIPLAKDAKGNLLS
jgi:PAS domain S-box-containing protein